MKAALSLVAATLCVASAASAEPLMDAFRQTCAPVNNSPAAALAKADAGGWAATPGAAVAQALLQGAAPGSTVEARHKTSPSGELVLMVMTVKKGPLHVESCQIVSKTADIQAVRAAAQAFAGVPPTPQAAHPELTMYMWRSTPSGHVALGGNPSAEDLKAGRLSTLAVGQQNGNSTLGGTTIRIVAP